MVSMVLFCPFCPSFRQPGFDHSIFNILEVNMINARYPVWMPLTKYQWLKATDCCIWGLGFGQHFFVLGYERLYYGIGVLTQRTNEDGGVMYRYYHCLLVTDVEFYECGGDSGGYREAATVRRLYRCDERRDRSASSQVKHLLAADCHVVLKMEFD